MRLAALLTLAAVAGCADATPSATCHVATKCEEFFDYTRTELDVANNACNLSMGGWSTTESCDASGTVGTCRILYTGDPNAHSITWYNALGYSTSSAMDDCQKAGGMFVAAN